MATLRFMLGLHLYQHAVDTDFLVCFNIARRSLSFAFLIRLFFANLCCLLPKLIEYAAKRRKQKNLVYYSLERSCYQPDLAETNHHV